MQNSRDLAGLNRHQIASHSVDDGLKHNETVKVLHHSAQDKATSPRIQEFGVLQKFYVKFSQTLPTDQQS
jgi:hypothetical protein